MKKGLAIWLGCLYVLLQVTSCKRSADNRSEDLMRIEKARQTVSNYPSGDTDFQKAQALLLEVLSSDPDNIAANQLLAQMYYQQAELVFESLQDEASLTQLESAQTKRVYFLQKALYHINRYTDTTLLKKKIEDELYLNEE